MKNTIAALALIATAVACTEPVETTEEEIIVIELDSNTLEDRFDDDSFGEEVVVEEVEADGELASEE